LSFLETDNKNLQAGNTSTILNQTSNANLQLETALSPWVVNLLQLQFNHHRIRNDYGIINRYDQDEFDIGIQQVYSTKGLLIEPQTRYHQTYDKWINGLTISKNKNYLSYTEGFRSPTLVAHYQENIYSTQNENLKPETSRQIEFGHRATSYQVK